MRIQFYDDPIQEPRSREEVRFNSIGLFLHDGGRRFAVGFDLTPFRERPSIHVYVLDTAGNEITSMTIVEAMQTNFSLTMHMPEVINDGLFEVNAILYYSMEGSEKYVVDQISQKLEISKPGEQ